MRTILSSPRTEGHAGPVASVEAANICDANVLNKHKAKPGLHLGCGRTQRPAPHFINCDVYHRPNVDCVFDALSPWPFEDSTASEIYGSHFLEHLPDHFHFFKEAWRVLEDGGKMTLRVPYGGHRSAWYDPEHQRPWYVESFAFLQPGYNDAIFNPQYDGWPAPFYVQCVSQRVCGKWQPFLKWYTIRKRLLPWLGHIPDAVEELWMEAYALKTDASLTAYAAQHPSNYVPTRMLMYAHEWHKTPQAFALLDITGKQVSRAF